MLSHNTEAQRVEDTEIFLSRRRTRKNASTYAKATVDMEVIESGGCQENLTAFRTAVPVRPDAACCSRRIGFRTMVLCVLLKSPPDRHACPTCPTLS